MKTLFMGLAIAAALAPAAAWAGEGFDVVALGARGGIEDGNLSAYLVGAHGQGNYVACDAGALVNGLRVADGKGAFDDVEYDDVTVTMVPGDTLLLYTDGITEGRRGGDFYGDERLLALLSREGVAGAGGVVDRVLTDVLEYQEQRPRDDIAVLAEHLIKKHSHRTGKRIDRVEDGVIEAMQRYDWPGNVRELENTIERAVVLATTGVITARNVAMLPPAAPAEPTAGLPSLKLHQNIEWAERETVRRALEQSGGVKKDAAELMGISQRALSYYLAKYRIE